MITAGSRIMMKMSDEGFLSDKFAFINKKKKTPTYAIGFAGSLITVLGVSFSLLASIENVYDWYGTIAVWGFLIAYLLVTISAPVFLFKNKSLKIGNIISALITGLLLLIPIIGSIYPEPSGPAKFFPFIFVGWIIISLIFYDIRKRKLLNTDFQR